MARLYEPRRQHHSLKRNINTRPTGRTEARKGVSPPVRTSGTEEERPLKGEELSIEHLLEILTRNASSASKQAAGLLTIRTRSVSKRTAGIKTSCLWTERSFLKRTYSLSLRNIKALPTTRKQETKL